MAIKLNPSALQDKAIEEAKLSQEVQEKLNRGGVEEAPIDGKPYVRQDAGWVGYDYPETEPEVREFTEAGTFTIQVPVGKHYCKAFIVNGGNGGDGGRENTIASRTTVKCGGGGFGGNVIDVLFSVKQLTDIIIVVGNGGNGGEVSYEGTIYDVVGKPGEQSSIKYNNIIYAPEPQHIPAGQDGIEGNGTNGHLNPYNEEDTNLYGAGGGGSYGSPSGPDGYAGGQTGGGRGASMNNGTNPSTDGLFYGAGGGGAGYTWISSSSTHHPNRGCDGYRGYVYLKFT